jgi:hypothetical protein
LAANYGFEDRYSQDHAPAIRCRSQPFGVPPMNNARKKVLVSEY